MLIEYGLAIRILFVTGIINLALGLLLFLTCRCIGTTPILNMLLGDKKFQRFYGKHCYLWWLFFISIIVHGAMAFYLFSFPF